MSTTVGSLSCVRIRSCRPARRGGVWAFLVLSYWRPPLLTRKEEGRPSYPGVETGFPLPFDFLPLPLLSLPPPLFFLFFVFFRSLPLSPFPPGELSPRATERWGEGLNRAPGPGVRRATSREGESARGTRAGLAARGGPGDPVPVETGSGE